MSKGLIDNSNMLYYTKDNYIYLLFKYEDICIRTEPEYKSMLESKKAIYSSFESSEPPNMKFCASNTYEDYLNPCSCSLLIQHLKGCYCITLNSQRMYIDLRKETYKQFDFSIQGVKMLCINAEFIFGFNKIKNNEGLYNPKSEDNNQIICTSTYTLFKFLVYTEMIFGLDIIFIQQNCKINLNYLISLVKIHLDGSNHSIQIVRSKSKEPQGDKNWILKVLSDDYNESNEFKFDRKNLIKFVDQISSDIDIVPENYPNFHSMLFEVTSSNMIESENQEELSEYLFLKNFEFYKNKLEISKETFNQVKLNYDSLLKFEFRTTPNSIAEVLGKDCTDKYIYYGELNEKSQRTGLGICLYENGKLYQAYWEKDQPHTTESHPIGRLVLANGAKYEGEFKFGDITGRGKITNPDGTFYEGQMTSSLTADEVSEMEGKQN